MTSDDDGLGPSRDDLGDALEENRLPEDGSVEDVADSTVGRLVHVCKVELLDALFVGRNSGTLDSYVVLEDRLRSIDCHLVLGLALKNTHTRQREREKRERRRETDKEVMMSLRCYSEKAKCRCSICKRKKGLSVPDFVVFSLFSHLLTVLHAQIVVLNINVDMRQDQLGCINKEEEAKMSIGVGIIRRFSAVHRIG